MGVLPFRAASKPRVILCMGSWYLGVNSAITHELRQTGLIVPVTKWKKEPTQANNLLTHLPALVEHSLKIVALDPVPTKFLQVSAGM